MAEIGCLGLSKSLAMLWESPATVWDGNTQGWIMAVKIQPGGRPGAEIQTYVPPCEV